MTPLPAILAACTLFVIALPARAQTGNAGGGICPSVTQERIQACLDQVEKDEGTRPCSSSDWLCICTKQQGMGVCYTGCPQLIPHDQSRFDQENCAGQHDGIQLNLLGGTLMYTWSDLNIPLNGEQLSDHTNAASPSNSAGGGSLLTPDDSPAPPVDSPNTLPPHSVNQTGLPMPTAGNATRTNTTLSPTVGNQPIAAHGNDAARVTSVRSLAAVPLAASSLLFVMTIFF